MHIDKYRDPQAAWQEGFLYPPGENACGYDTAHDLIQVGILGFCGCGRPEENLKFVRDGLAHINERMGGPDPWKDRAGWDAHWKAVKADEKRIFGSDGAAYFFFYWASKEDLTEHGGSVPGWLTDKGRELLEDLQSLNLDEVT